MVLADGKRQKIKAKIGGKDWDAESYSVIADKNLIRLRNAKGGIDEHEIAVSWTPASGAVDGTTYTVYQAYNGNESAVYSVTRNHWSESSYAYFSGDDSFSYRVRDGSTISAPAVVYYCRHGLVAKRRWCN